MSSELMTKELVVLPPPMEEDEEMARPGHRERTHREGLERLLSDLGEKMEALDLPARMVLLVANEVREAYARGIEAGADAVCPEFAEMSLRLMGAESRLDDLRRRYVTVSNLAKALEAKVRERGLG